MSEKMIKLNPSRRNQPIVVTTYPHNFGILIPCQTGVFWEQQTCGVMCNHVQVEGIFIPLVEPTKLLAELRDANYDYKPKEVARIWEEIKNEMQFHFKEVPNPDPSKYPDTQEGLMWIKIKDFHSGWGHGQWVNQFKDKIVILIYPNSD